MPASKAQQKAVAKYMKNNYDEIKIRIPKGEKEKIKVFAASRGESVNAYICRLIENDMKESGRV
ncbi:MAG: Arc family DNA-binding protein [Massiliimalia sp.]|jgi:predicted HicB family RNase H-like nuclease